jgi:hypothetical protein
MQKVEKRFFKILYIYIYILLLSLSSIIKLCVERWKNVWQFSSSILKDEKCFTTTKHLFIVNNGENTWWTLSIFSLLIMEKMFGDHYVFFPLWKLKKHLTTTKCFFDLEHYKNAWEPLNIFSILINVKTPSSR